MSHNSALVTHSRTDARDTATENAPIRLAFSQMATGIKIPKSVAWRLYDSKRGRVALPLGPYPEVAEACAEAGASFFHISRPLAVMMAHLRRRCSNKMPLDIKSALVTAQREESEAECAELNLALSVNGPEHSVLLAFVKEEREALVAKEHVVELAEDLLAQRESE